MRRRGLTIVEVMVGLAIVLVLVAVCFGGVLKMVGRAKGSACAERLHTLGTALAIYANYHDGYLPPATTVEFAYRDAKSVSPELLRGSPALLRGVMRPYVPGERAWFCPVDPQSGKDVLWLGQRHLLTSFAYAPQTEGERTAWPPRMQLGSGPAELIGDAYGVPSKDSERQFASDSLPRSNHPDSMVNVVAQDLSLSRHPARLLIGSP